MAKTYLKTTYTDGSPDQYADFSEYAAKMKVRVAQNYKNIKQILEVDKEEEGANVLQEIYKNPMLGMKVETVDTTAFTNQISEKDAEIEKIKAELEAAKAEAAKQLEEATKATEAAKAEAEAIKAEAEKAAKAAAKK